MRVLADTNLFISYLLNSGDKSSAAQTFFHAALIEGRFVLLVPQDVLKEIMDTISRKPYLRKYIRPQQAARLVKLVKAIGIEISVIEEPIPKICRDPKDDYLLAYALIGGADYLVTGDQDLLSLQQIGPITIVSPAQFATLIERG